jgi:hypothetical protein
MRVYSRREEPSGLNSRNDLLGLTLTHQLSSKTSTFAGFSATRFSTEDVSLSNQDANSVFVGVHHRF